MPRLGYSKSRTGCLKCRQRRVKCDEKRPCSACQRHGIPCSLVTNGTSPTEDGSSRSQPLAMFPGAARSIMSAPASSSPSRPRSIKRSGSSSSRPTASPIAAAAAIMTSGSETAISGSDAARSVSDAGTGQSPLSAVDTNMAGPSSSKASPSIPPDGVTPPDKHHLWATDMELMHHYSTVAFKTMPRAEDVGQTWLIEAVQASFDDDYILHLILAFSAFHLADLRPQRRPYYLYIAVHHQDLGISRMRASLSRLNAENCHSLFMAGSLLAVTTFSSLAVHASDKAYERPLLDDIVEVFILIKGMGIVLNVWEKEIQCGPFRELFRLTKPSTPPPIFWQDMRAQLDYLRKPLSGLILDQPAVLDVVDREIRELYDLTTSCVLTSADPELRLVMVWPINISDQYLQLLKEKVPAALVVLGYYCVVVDRSAVRNWFTRSWAREALYAINSILPPYYTDLLRWPLDQVSVATPVLPMPVIPVPAPAIHPPRP